MLIKLFLSLLLIITSNQFAEALSTQKANKLNNTKTAINSLYKSPQVISQNNGDSATITKPQYTGIVKKVDDIAEQITVRIDVIDNQGKKSNGSGVIITKQGTTYYVATARHVIKEDLEYHIVTPDGATHQLDNTTKVLSNAFDLAIFSFESENDYEVATVGNYIIAVNRKKIVFLSGFAGSKNNHNFERKITAGLVFEVNIRDSVGKDSYSLISNGQGLVYTNISYAGMSGGAVLDREGKLIGINTGTEGEFVINDGVYDELMLGNSLGVNIQDIIGFLEIQTPVKLSWLKQNSNNKIRGSWKDWENIRDNLLIAIPPNNMDDVISLMNFGDQLKRFARYEEAINIFQKVIEIDPKYDKA